jgi:hypothetical protein
MNTRWILSCAALCCAAATVLVFPAKRSTLDRASGPLPCEMYVWQRVWNEPVRNAVITAPDWVSGLAPLAAEITWRNDGSPLVAWARVDFAALRRSERSVAAVLRIGPRTPSAEAKPQVCAVARELLARFTNVRVRPSELQVDFDCAESQLAGYRDWLTALREVAAPIAVRPTVLPSWLKQKEFAALARESAAFILQVHATNVPRLDAPETELCEAESARQWVEQAGQIGIPFRVALPTYTYEAAFAPGGRLLEIMAEGEARVWPADTIIRAFRPDAAQLAQLIANWQHNRPAGLTGVIWYRLPVATDRLNWRWPTITAVMSGHTPRRELRVEKSAASPMDLTLVNAGEAEEPLPRQVIVVSQDDRVEGDAVGGYQAEMHGRELILQRPPELAHARLAPGTRHPLGWLRTTSEISIHVR